MSRKNLPLPAAWLILFIPAAVPPAIRAQAPDPRFELHGKVVNEEGKPHRRVFPLVFLRGATSPFVTDTQAGPDGRFKIRNLSAGSYTLVVQVPGAGESQRTIEVGPTFADAKRRVRIEIACCVGAGGAEHHVAASQLAIPADAQQKYRGAQASLSRRDVESAIAQLKEAVEIAPHFVEAWNNLGTIAYQTRKYAEAERCFREGLKHDGHAYSPLVNLGGALLSQGKVAEALEVNLQAVGVRPDDALGQVQLGFCYYYLGRFDEAEKHIRMAKTIDPAHFSHPQLVLADIHQRRLNYKALVEELEEFLKLHPDSREAGEVRVSLEQARKLLQRP